jgi:hypothetical protein
LNNTAFFFTSVALMLALLGCAALQPEVEQASPTIDLPVEAVRLSLEDAKTAFDDGSAVFLDVRSRSAYATTHIPGAVSIPLAELKPRIAELDPSQWIITYCT